MDFQTLNEKIKTLVGTDSGLNATVKFSLDEGVIFIDATQVPNIVHNEDLEADCVMSISTKNALALIAGDLNPMMALMMGKLKIKGDMGVAMKIGQAMGGS